MRQITAAQTINKAITDAGDAASKATDETVKAEKEAEKKAKQAELDALKDTWFNNLGGKVIALTGTIKGNGDYINITTADGAANKPYVQLSVAGDIKTTFSAKGTDGKYVNEGKTVTAYVVYRGNNVDKGNLQFQLIDFTIAEA